MLRKSHLLSNVIFILENDLFPSNGKSARSHSHERKLYDTSNCLKEFKNNMNILKYLEISLSTYPTLTKQEYFKEKSGQNKREYNIHQLKFDCNKYYL